LSDLFQDKPHFSFNIEKKKHKKKAPDMQSGAFLQAYIVQEKDSKSSERLTAFFCLH